MPSPQPLVSVVMPAYNAQRTIGASISGVLTQTYPAVELIVVDDGSSDATAAICHGFGGLIRYVAQENGGSAKARNHGLSLARGEYIAFCDADDILLPPYLDANLSLLQTRGGRRIAMNEALLLTASGVSHGRRLIGSRFPRPAQQRLAILERNFVPILSVFPRELLDDVAGFDESLRYREDWDLWLRAILSDWEVVYQRTPHALYRFTQGAKSTHSARHDAEAAIVRNAWDQYADTLTPQERRYLELRLNNPTPGHLDLQGRAALARGDYDEARSVYGRLTQLSPTDRRTKVKSTLIAQVPGFDRVWRRRLDRIGVSLGQSELER